MGREHGTLRLTALTLQGPCRRRPAESVGRGGPARGFGSITKPRLPVRSRIPVGATLQFHAICFKPLTMNDRSVARTSERDRRGAPPREPIFSAPPVVVWLAVLLVAIFAVVHWSGPRVEDQVIRTFAFVP